MPTIGQKVAPWVYAVSMRRWDAVVLQRFIAKDVSVASCVNMVSEDAFGNGTVCAERAKAWLKVCLTQHSVHTSPSLHLLFCVIVFRMKACLLIYVHVYY